MDSSSLLIKNGLITTHNRQFRGDILVSNGKIESLGKKIYPPGKETDIIDAEGFLVFPGGVDPHVHMSLSTGYGRSSDDFETGSIAAISGGTTTLIDFITPDKGESLISALEKRKKEAENSVCDYGLHMSITSIYPGIEKEIYKIVTNEGITSFKLYMAYRKSVGMADPDILKAMVMIKKAGGISMIHCENGDMEEFLREKMISSEKTEIKYYPESRPPEMENDAVERAIMFSDTTKCPLYIVHMTTEKGVEAVLKAKKSGISVYSETCPHYLFLDDSVYKKGSGGAKYIMSPPLRKLHDIAGLWNGLSEGVLEVISTDHCPFNLKGENGSGTDDFTKIPKGVGGVDHRLSFLYSKGVLEKKITIHRFVNLISTRPAKIFGLYPQKGTIMKGSDADLVIWDPDKKTKISAETQIQNCDSSVYEGMEVTGGPSRVITGGRVVFDNGNFDLSRTKGNFLYRKR